MTADLVVHVPHASTEIPDDVAGQFLVDRDAIRAEALASADLHTDLLAAEAWPEANLVRAEVSRLVVDVERYADDSREEMARVGRGVIYTHDHQGRPLRRVPGLTERADLLARYYEPHWRHLRGSAAGAVLIDLHTYPVDPWPIERHATSPRPEIDIGFTTGLTPLLWVDTLTRHFRDAGYSVGHNTPYAGVIDAGARAAVMIEIRRDVVGEPGANRTWLRLVETLAGVPRPALAEPS